MDYMSFNFDTDSSGRFPFRVRTNRQTNTQAGASERQPHAGIQPAWVIRNTNTSR